MANTIEENIYSQVDEKGNQYQLMYQISNKKSDNRTFPKSEVFMVARNGNRDHEQTTKGWYLKVQWKDGKNLWVPLREMKESHGIQTTEYAEANELKDKLALARWDQFTLKKKDKMFDKVKS